MANLKDIERATTKKLNKKYGTKKGSMKGRKERVGNTVMRKRTARGR